ncbi:hypothetical protein ThidrDRAFT_0684 [Thiorhodococcus drewsii AZ1]|uniref:Lipoprotein n=1 Tax=Thiorhodococcus drewsii AZ1 TaxID=765913 RepID=G2DXC3_9GAMM|nr:hypothetical protein ThidrDRAFT_0684 [Thiorhodococcus drewsii AZ1]
MTPLKRVAILLLIAFVVGVTAGCRTSPVRDINNVPVPNPPASYSQMERAIVTAGSGLG